MSLCRWPVYRPKDVSENITKNTSVDLSAVGCFLIHFTQTKARYTERIEAKHLLQSHFKLKVAVFVPVDVINIYIGNAAACSSTGS